MSSHHNTPPTPLSADDLHRLIARYFDGDTDIAEERLLRTALADQSFNSPAVEEARAVLGYFAVAAAPRRQRRRAGFTKPVIRRVAAVAGIVIALSAWIALSGRNDGECTAYIAGQRTDDITIIRKAIMLQLESASEAADDVNAAVASEFASMSEIMADTDNM